MQEVLSYRAPGLGLFLGALASRGSGCFGTGLMPVVVVVMVEERDDACRPLHACLRLLVHVWLHNHRNAVLTSSLRLGQGRRTRQVKVSGWLTIAVD